MSSRQRIPSYVSFCANRFKVVNMLSIVRHHHCSSPLRANPLSCHGPRWWYPIHCVVCNYRVSCTPSRSCDHGCYHEHGPRRCPQRPRPSAQLPSPLRRCTALVPWHVTSHLASMALLMLYQVQSTGVWNSVGWVGTKATPVYSSASLLQS